MYFITTKRMLELCFSAHPNIQYRTFLLNVMGRWLSLRAIAFQERTTPIRVVPQKF